MRKKDRVSPELPATGQVHIVLFVVLAVQALSDSVHKRRSADAVVDIGAEGSLRYQYDLQHSSGRLVCQTESHSG